MIEFVKQIEDKTLWDTFVKKHPYGHFLQGWSWGEFKSPHWQPLRLAVLEKNNILAAVQVLRRNLFFGKKLFYVPRGPVLNPKEKSYFKLLMQELIRIAKEERAVEISFEPNFIEEEAKGLFDNSFLKATSIQPNDTSIIDLTISEEAILAQMHPKSRQYLHKAISLGVEFIEDKEGAEFSEFLKIMTEIRKRSRILLHPNIYYKKFWDLYKTKGAILVFVKVKTELDGTSILLGFGDTIYDLYGGPRGLYPETKSSHLLKWMSIKTAKKMGFSHYDQMGLAPAGDSTHHYAGVSIFKERFGGKRITYAGNLVYPVSSFWYLVWRLLALAKNPLARLLKVAGK